MGHVLLWASVMDGWTWLSPSLTDSLAWMSDPPPVTETETGLGLPGGFSSRQCRRCPILHSPRLPRLYPHTSPSLLQDYPSIHPSHRPPFSSVRHHRQQGAHTSFRPPSSLRPICMQPCRAPVGVVRAGRPSQGIRAAGKTGAEKRNAENLISLRIIPL